MANHGKRMVREDLIGQGGSGSEYTAGTGIEISDEDVISVDTDTIATTAALTSFTESFGGALNNILNTGDYIVQKARKDENGNEIDTTYATKAELPASVSGTNDGTNWTSLTIGNTTKGIPSGSGNVIEKYAFSGFLTQAEYESLNPGDNFRCIIDQGTAYESVYEYTINYKDSSTIKGYINNISFSKANYGSYTALTANYYYFNAISFNYSYDISGGSNTTLFYYNNDGSDGVYIDENDNHIKSIIPPCPTTTDGTYTLKCVVSNGVATYSWVAQS